MFAEPFLAVSVPGKNPVRALVKVSSELCVVCGNCLVSCCECGNTRYDDQLRQGYECEKHVAIDMQSDSLVLVAFAASFGIVLWWGRCLPPLRMEVSLCWMRAPRAPSLCWAGACWRFRLRGCSVCAEHIADIEFGRAAFAWWAAKYAISEGVHMALCVRHNCESFGVLEDSSAALL